MNEIQVWVSIYLVIGFATTIVSRQPPTAGIAAVRIVFWPFQMLGSILDLDDEE